MKPVSIVVREDAMVPLDRWLATELARELGRPVPRGLTRKAILRGLVAVGGRIIRDASLVLHRGPSVFVRNLDWIPSIAPAAPLTVLFEDQWLIACDKPPGLPTHETADVTRPSLTGLVERRVGRRVFVHHRLDAGTSGVVLFAKLQPANPRLARSFAEREVEKTYIALVQRPAISWPKEMRIDSPIALLKSGGVRVDLTGLAALTRVRVLEGSRDRLLVEAHPVTGRKHQVRVHLASAGAPIIGDTRYGAKTGTAARLMLHAERLSLDHPITGQRLTIVSPRPGEFTVRGATPVLSTLRPPRAAIQPQATPAPAPRPGGGPRHAKPLRTETGPQTRVREGVRGSRR
jgi:RluA family pseudouridine synthase